MTIDLEIFIGKVLRAYVKSGFCGKWFLTLMSTCRIFFYSTLVKEKVFYLAMAKNRRKHGFVTILEFSKKNDMKHGTKIADDHH